ncbi:MAG: hypothetical protein AB7F59_12240 [Bdellovibrionales bacterium]
MASKWTCQFVNSDGSTEGAEATPSVTVGQVLTLNCQGPEVVMDVSKLRVVPVSQPEFTLKLLKSDFQNTKAQFQFASYRVGEHKNVVLAVTDDKNFFESDPLSWTVKTVIDPQNPEAMKPFGAYGPWKISWPLWYFLVLVLLIAAVSYAVYRSVQAYLKKKKLKKDVEEYRKKHNPFDQFQKELRALHRFVDRATGEVPTETLKEWLKDTRNSSLIYLKMEFGVETMSQSPRKIVRAIKKKYPRAPESRLNDLYLYLVELQQMRSKDFTRQDVDQILNWAQKTSDQVNHDELGRKR